MVDLSIIAKRPDLPVIVFVDNYELAGDYDTTAQEITKVEVTEIVSWNERMWTDEEEFIEEFIEYHWCEGVDEKKIEAKACELWEEHAKECIVCYSHAAMIPKGCEIE